MAKFMFIDAASVDICAKIRDVRLSDRRMTIDVKDAIVLAKIAPAAKHVSPKLRRIIAVRAA